MENEAKKMRNEAKICVNLFRKLKQKFTMEIFQELEKALYKDDI
jgi:hypothetical protein